MALALALRAVLLCLNVWMFTPKAREAQGCAAVVWLQSRTVWSRCEQFDATGVATEDAMEGFQPSATAAYVSSCLRSFPHDFQDREPGNVQLEGQESSKISNHCSHMVRY